MHIGHKTYRHCLHAWLEDACKVLRHNSYCKWAIEATMVWRKSANKTPWFSCVIVVSCCVQTNSPCHVKSMGIVPMHEWKVPLKYRAMLLFPSGPLGRGGAATPARLANPPRDFYALSDCGYARFGSRSLPPDPWIPSTPSFRPCSSKTAWTCSRVFGTGRV